MRQNSSIFCAIIFMAGCDSNLNVTASGPMGATATPGFRILNAEEVTNNDPSISWALDGNEEAVDLRKGIDLVLAKDAECQQPSVRLPGVLESQTTLRVIDDGQYFICAYAFDKNGQRIAASNNGIPVTVDRKAPQIDLAGTHTAKGPLTLSPTVTDLTPVTYQWKVIKGPGSIVIEPDTTKDTKLTFTAAGVYELSLTATDAADNQTIKTLLITYTTPQLPVFTSLTKISDASDGYINDAEKSSPSALWTLSASGHTTAQYTAPLDNTVPVTCDNGQTYDQSGIPSATNLTSDKPWVICVKLTNDDGVTYGKSDVVVRDVTAPTFTSLVLANDAVDGYLNYAETGAGNPIWALTASGYVIAEFTTPLDDSTPITCDGSKSYINANITGLTVLSTETSYTMCVRLTDAAGNITYGKGETVVLDITAPTPAVIGVVHTVEKHVQSLRVNWFPASDTHSSAANLLYRLYRSTSPNFNTLSEVKAGTAVNPSPANISTYIATNLTPDTVYYFNIVVRDEAGNEAVYTKVSDETRDDGFTQVSVGSASACGITSEGKIYCWGYNTSGILGTGVAGDVFIPYPINSSDRFKKVSVGGAHACAIRSDNRILCWGEATNGKLGNNSTSPNQLSPVLINSTDTFRDISTGLGHTCAVRTDGLAFCWGSDNGGELGNGATTGDQLSPVQVSGLTDVKSIHAGNSYTCVLRADGDAYCWGANSTGNLGNGSFGINQDAPIAVLGGNKFRQLSVHAISSTACGITSSGAAYCWGRDVDLQLGDDAIIADQPTPVAVTGGYTFRDISVGNVHTCAITDAGAAASGSLGNGATSNTHIPQLVSGGMTWRSIAVGTGSCGIIDTGAAYCWGLGATTGVNPIDQPTPVAVRISYLSGDAEFIKVGAGEKHSCALKANGKVYCWGDDTFAQLGDNATLAKKKSPTLVALPERVMDLSVGHYASCATAPSGNLYCWGSDHTDAIGTSAVEDAPTPVQVGAGQKWFTSTSGLNFNCAIRSDGKPYCWGDNGIGQLGIGVMYGTFPTPSAVDVNISEHYVAIAAGRQHTCGILDSGATKCWGGNTDGQVGDGAFLPVISPVTVSTVPALQVALGGTHTCQLSAAGQTRCWGTNAFGQLGTGDNIAKSTPTLIDASNQYLALAATRYASCGIRANGRGYCWGNDSDGQLGDDAASAHKNAPTAIALTTELRALNGKHWHYLAISCNGTSYAWGPDIDNQLGDDLSTTSRYTPSVIGTLLTGVLSEQRCHKLAQNLR